eukprot:2930327-Pyramimonas_sp.AAC.2
MCNNELVRAESPTQTTTTGVLQQTISNPKQNPTIKERLCPRESVLERPKVRIAQGKYSPILKGARDRSQSNRDYVVTSICR